MSLHQPPHILFVEDNDDTREVVGLLLEQAGYDVVTADSVTSGITLAKETPFDLYLLDTRFPDGTGRDLCNRIREFDQKAPIIFYSTEAREFSKQQALTCGAQEYVTKPEITGLPEVIARCLPTG